MALPSLNATPSYELTIPSTQEKVKFRPFLVKEQKILMLAYESQDKKQVINSILDTIRSCVDGIEVSKLTTFDVDYIFTQLRAKSVGEKIALNLVCEECTQPTQVDVNIEEITVDAKESEKVVKLTDEVSVKLRYPSYYEFIANIDMNSNSQTNTIMKVITTCMDSVITEEEHISLKDETEEEVMKFIDSMNSEQFEAVSKFVQDMPIIKKDVHFACSHCSHEQTKELKGLDDFF